MIYDIIAIAGIIIGGVAVICALWIIGKTMKPKDWGIRNEYRRRKNSKD